MHFFQAQKTSCKLAHLTINNDLLNDGFNDWGVGHVPLKAIVGGATRLWSRKKKTKKQSKLIRCLSLHPFCLRGYQDLDLYCNMVKRIL